MNRDILNGNWEELKGKIKQHWAKLTDDELLEIEGDRQQLSGKLMKSYGYNKEKVQEEINSFIEKLKQDK